MKVSGELHALAVLIPRKSLQYLLRRRRGGYHGESKHFVEENNPLPLLGIEPRLCGHAACNLVTDKEFLCITHTVEHNYISPSSTVGIQLHVSALYVGHLQVVI